MVVIIRDKNLYYVGGVVRDELLGTTSFDTDFCYEGNALDFAKKFNVIKENPEFGTVKVLIDEEEIDIASTRTEKYPIKGHLPVVDKIGCSLKDDLLRRDFTINAMAKNTVTGEIVDYFNGKSDIKNKKLKVLHDRSFIDDPTRIIRGLKFAVRFGFDLDEITKKLQDEYLENINYDISYHRLKKELKETFNLNKMEAFEIFINEGIYKLLGENQELLPIKCNISKLVKEFNIKTPWLVYLGLFDLYNFSLTTEEASIITCFNNIKNKFPRKDIEIYNLFRSCPIESILLYAITQDYDVAMRYLRELSKIKIEINGKDLQEIGIKQGKIYQQIFDLVLEQKFKNTNFTKVDEIEFVRSKFL